MYSAANETTQRRRNSSKIREGLKRLPGELERGQPATEAGIGIGSVEEEVRAGLEQFL